MSACSPWSPAETFPFNAALSEFGSYLAKKCTNNEIEGEREERRDKQCSISYKPSQQRSRQTKSGATYVSCVIWGSVTLLKLCH